MRSLIIATALLLCAQPAYAGASVKFSAYEGPNAERIGDGGTKITKNGIDYWDTGSPARRYQVLGVITDKRYEEWGDGSAVGSAKIARLVLKLGGNAVIVMGENTTGSGAYSVPTGGGASVGLGLDRTKTQLVVVKYLD